ncbi:site-specific DNA-methyltransferase [Sediminicola luteus]|uniref:site-specific DNA-methyltransferase (adenine-specific) n=1 Tax=Sediminicola luteus TaxID=319238 RepID=A0A2A4GB51_9FLAO|nr:site-specific DNA-methyltransferase [Sediminicola luteus]PCE64982.1 site-specific DNA-methyltransferase [Sediminicola luteus]
MQELNMQSPNWVNENSKFIAERFPNCVTETAEGFKVDFDLLKQELSTDLVEGNKERYRLEWPGKKEAIVTANLPTTKTLRPVREDSVDFDTTENLYIEGDNLEVLKILQESYLGKIKMIYIDPPYNTGKDFVYKDNFSKDSQEELYESGQQDENSRRLISNPDTSGRYHSNWLTMIYPRLKLARNLLCKKGIIFISIDDIEQHNLRKICDEIFGEENFIANIIWQKKYAPQNDAKYFSDSHEHILAYSKNKEFFKIGLLPRTEEANKRYSNPDNDHRGPWKSSDLTRAEYRPNDDFAIVNPINGMEFYPPKGNSWRQPKDKIEELISENRIWFGVNGDSRPSLKRYLSDVKQGITPQTIWERKDVGDTQEGKKRVKEIFENASIFETVKPHRLIHRMLKIANVKQGDTVLDFFSGSGTTAEAVLRYDCDLKFIQVQIPEKTDLTSEAHKMGFDNICEIGKERIRRAAKKIKEETGADIDYGFRVYRLDESNMKDVYYKPQEYAQDKLDLFADNVKSDRNPDDLLAQVMLDWGLPLSLRIQQANINGKKVFKVAENSLFAYFDDNIDEDFAKAIAEEKPLRIVFKDSGFKDDTAKTNVKQLLKQLSPETEMKVL